MPARLTIARNAAEIETLEPLWRDLARQSASATLFQSCEWNVLAAQVFGEREKPYAVAVETGSGAAIVPACITTEHKLKFLGDELFDYPDVLACGDSGALDRALRELSDLNLPMSLHGIRESSLLCQYDNQRPFAAAPFVSGLTSDELFLRHARSSRQLRRLHRLGVEPKRYSGKHHRLVEIIYRAKSASAGLFEDDLRRAFMTRICAASPVACEIFTLEQGSSLVAALVTFRDGDVRRFYTTYFDPEWSRYSPGLALLLHATAASLNEGLTCDYMTGEQSYKLRLATGSAPLFQFESVDMKSMLTAASRQAA